MKKTVLSFLMLFAVTVAAQAQITSLCFKGTGMVDDIAISKVEEAQQSGWVDDSTTVSNQTAAQQILRAKKGIYYDRRQCAFTYAVVVQRLLQHRRGAGQGGGRGRESGGNQ